MITANGLQAVDIRQRREQKSQEQLNPRGNLAPKEEQPLAAEETRGGSSLLWTVQSCLEALMDWFDQMKKALNDKNPFMEVSTLSLSWFSSTRTLRGSQEQDKAG